MSLAPYFITGFLLALSGFFSGVGLGFMTLSVPELERKAQLGNKAAERVLPVRRNGNLLLCTILLGNVLVNAVLAVFLGSLVSGVVAVAASTLLIVIFGEIVPQAVFARYALRLSSFMVPFVTACIFILYPVAKPISYVLDSALGREIRTTYTKKEIRLLIREHREHHARDINDQELTIMEGGLAFSEIPTRSIMVPRTRVFALKQDAVLDKKLLRVIRSVGYSRIPVENKRGDIVGILYTKDLVSFNPSAGASVGHIMREDVKWIYGTDPLGEALALARTSHIHLLFVRSSAGRYIGIVTLEDILECIVGEIADEHDADDLE